MRLDGIEKEVILINPYRTDSGQKQSIQAELQNIKETKMDLNEINTNSVKDNTQHFNLSQEELNKLIEEFRHKFSMLEKYLQINIDQELKMPISKIIDMRTEEVIRQIPPDWLVEILRRMEELKGVFYYKEV